MSVTLWPVVAALAVPVTGPHESPAVERGTVRFSGPTADLLDRSDLARAVFFGSVAETAS